jgi:hypothetical protein
MLLHLPIAITDSHFNLLAGLLPIPKDTAPPVALPSANLRKRRPV